jgi:rubrerythrin
MKTNENLEAAFAGESQANRKYLAFAKKAQDEGRSQVAKLFRAAAAAETVHALAHLRVMNGVGPTAENLKAAIAGEAYEFQSMYPQFVKTAEDENQRGAVATFKNAMAVEKTHHALFTAALEAIGAGKDLAPAEIWICEVCGHTHVGDDAPEHCPVCNALRKAFTRVV